LFSLILHNNLNADSIVDFFDIGVFN
jgi:hypothetical protein